MTNAGRAAVDARLLALPALCAAAMYARFFGGFWLGDDFANVERAWLAGESGDLWRQAWEQLFMRLASEGAFYRPLMIASLFANEAIAGVHAAGWFAVNMAVHVVNVVLVGALAGRLAAASDSDGRASGFAAALFFALCPLLAEGVFWISARADAFVTALTLAGVYAWATARTSAGQALALPLLLLPALGFKESAAVLPLQMLLVALAWPPHATRAQWLAVIASFLLVASFLALRAHLFGDAWQVYRSADAAPSPARFRNALASLGAWSSGLTRGAPAAARLYAVLAGGALLLLAATATTRGARLVLALLAASAGLFVATLLNLGGFAPTGEGGRLLYSPIAWLALALGVAGATPVASGMRRRRTPRAGVVVLTLAAIAGATLLETVLSRALRVEDDMRLLADSIGGFARDHPGLTLLVIPEQEGPVVTGRNAQGALALPPLQSQPLLHRVLPTLPGEIGVRHEQLSAGLATRLDALRPSRIDAAASTQLSRPDAPRWPDHYACWSGRERRIVELPPPDTLAREGWVAALQQASSRCLTR